MGTGCTNGDTVSVGTAGGQVIGSTVQVSEAYFHPNGKALKKVLYDMYHLYGDNRFVRLSHLSVSRLYDFRKSPTYQNEVLTYTKTRPTTIAIGERKKPYPEGKPGFLRVDSVHQGDLDKEKGSTTSTWLMR